MFIWVYSGLDYYLEIPVFIYLYSPVSKNNLRQIGRKHKIHEDKINLKHTKEMKLGMKVEQQDRERGEVRGQNTSCAREWVLEWLRALCCQTTRSVTFFCDLEQAHFTSLSFLLKKTEVQKSTYFGVLLWGILENILLRRVSPYWSNSAWKRRPSIVTHSLAKGSLRAGPQLSTATEMIGFPGDTVN